MIVKTDCETDGALHSTNPDWNNPPPACVKGDSLCVALGPTLSIGLGLLVILKLGNGYNFQVKAGLFPNRQWNIFWIISTFISSQITFPKNICGKHILISCLLWQEGGSITIFAELGAPLQLCDSPPTIINFTSDSFNFLLNFDVVRL